MPKKGYDVSQSLVFVFVQYISIIPPMKWGIGTTAEAKHTFKQSKTPFNMLLGTVVDWIAFLFSDTVSLHTNTLVLAC